MKTLKPC